MPLTVKQIINRPVNSNCFIIYDKIINNECIIIDPGTEDCYDLELFLLEYNLIPIKIILTHEHFDHCWGCNYLQEKYNIPILCSDLCSKKVRYHKTNYSVFYSPQCSFDVPGEIIILHDHDVINFNSYNINIFLTPGHTDSSITIIIENHIFTGDSLIKGLKTVTKLPGGSKTKLLETISFYWNLKGNNYIVHPGHLEEFLLDQNEY